MEDKKQTYLKELLGLRKRLRASSIPRIFHKTGADAGTSDTIEECCSNSVDSNESAGTKRDAECSMYASSGKDMGEHKPSKWTLQSNIGIVGKGKDRDQDDGLAWLAFYPEFVQRAWWRGVNGEPRQGLKQPWPLKASPLDEANGSSSNWWKHHFCQDAEDQFWKNTRPCCSICLLAKEDHEAFKALGLK